MKTMDPIEAAYEHIIEAFKEMGYNTKADLDNFAETPHRYAKAMREYVWPKQKIISELGTKILCKSFPMEKESDFGLVLTDAVVVGLCPHHIAPVFYQMYIAYMPKDEESLLGASKLIRIAEVLAKRPVLQEQLAVDIASVLYQEENKTEFPGIDSLGSFCAIGASHTCMSSRGVKSFSLLRSAVVRGVFKSNPSIKQEIYDLIKVFPSVSFPFK